ncbi:metal ABC transporter solute-binding protein, Zn/Mn family [Alkalicoccus daliensis]|uniref:Iron/zinc/copper transport system substrate-binding protein n=1 Tax=Alkalicoccus daliensis TaxID=745820 RepID=A0A1H0BHL5_9BACI|nr:zinc ABC transporter substrate-binding protein [Alkalicoccus daliensis]SDN45120.1 iron/zinc/copper transport system substrate-binding protein [Alkalicoccus daliensis]
MKKLLPISIAGILFLSACGNDSNDASSAAEADELMVTTSFSVIADMAEAVVGEEGSVDYIVPIGEEPHEYEPVPSNFQKVNDSHVFYVNGLGLEEWLERVVNNAAETEVVELAAGVDEITLVGEDAPDPHAWLSPKNIDVYIDNIVEDLSGRVPEKAEIFEENGEIYKQEAEELTEEIEEMMQEIPEEHRLIVVSENAFKYFGEDFNMDTDGIWEMNSHEEGTTGQMNRIIDVLIEREIPAVFVESTVDNRSMETVADNADISIAGEVFTDAVGAEGSGAETYFDMLRHNAETFADGLTNE